MRTRLGILALIAVAAALWSCETELPTAGRDAWGRNDGELGVITIGSTLAEMVADPHRPLLYVADFDGDLVHVISTETQQIGKSIFVGSRPSDLDISLDGSKLYVALLGGSEIAVVDLEHQVVVDRIALSFSPAYLVAGRPPYLYVTSSLVIRQGFTAFGQTYLINAETKSTESVIPQIGLLEPDSTRSRLYIGAHRKLYQYDITGYSMEFLNQVDTEGPIVELHVSGDGQRVYAISTGFFATPELIVSRGLITTEGNVEIDMVEVFGTDQLTKVGELYTGTFPRAVTGDASTIVVVASDSLDAFQPSGFANTYDAVSLRSLGTHRLVGTPTGTTELDPETGVLYVAVRNPYDLRERFGERQDVQVIPLHAADRDR